MILNSVYTGTVTAQIGLIEKYEQNRIRLTVAPTISDTDVSLQALRNFVFGPMIRMIIRLVTLGNVSRAELMEVKTYIYVFLALILLFK